MDALHLIHRRQFAAASSAEVGGPLLNILIIDDDQMVRTVCSGMLQVLTHETETCESGADALQRLAEPEACFDLLLLDDTMPEMSGRETLALLASREIRIPVIICSGQPVTLNGYCSVPGYDPVGQLTKPFSMLTLRALIDGLQAAT